MSTHNIHFQDKRSLIIPDISSAVMGKNLLKDARRCLK